MSLNNDIQIDKQKTALVVIDLQKGITATPRLPYDSNVVIANASKIADAFRKSAMSVFLVHVATSDKDRLKPLADDVPQMKGPPAKDWSEFVAEIGPKEGDVVITKRQWGAFYGTELELQLRRRGINTIVLGGISTNLGVESTARNAFELGYQQIFVEDAMSTSSTEEHNNTVNKIFKKIGRVRTTEQILNALR